MKNIYLDVDGVLNALSKKPPSHNTGWEGTWHSQKVDGGAREYTILWSEELISAINELDAHEDVQFIWLTTWMHMARTNISPTLGIKNGHKWPVLTGAEAPHGWTSEAAWWKLKEVTNHVSDTDPEQFVWIDDDIDVIHYARRWVDISPNGLGISPASQHGLAQRHIQQIKTFLSV